MATNTSACMIFYIQPKWFLLVPVISLVWTPMRCLTALTVPRVLYVATCPNMHKCFSAVCLRCTLWHLQNHTIQVQSCFSWPCSDLVNHISVVYFCWSKTIGAVLVWLLVSRPCLCPCDIYGTTYTLNIHALYTGLTFGISALMPVFPSILRMLSRGLIRHTLHRGYSVFVLPCLTP